MFVARDNQSFFLEWGSTDGGATKLKLDLLGDHAGVTSHGSVRIANDHQGRCKPKFLSRMGPAPLGGAIKLKLQTASWRILGSSRKVREA